MKCEFNGNGMSVSMGDEGKEPLLPFPGHFFCLTNLFGALAFFLSAAALSLCVVRISLSIAFFGVANLSQYLPTLPYDPVQMADFVRLSHTLGILGLVFVGLSTVLAVLSCCFFRRRSRLLYFGLFAAVAALVLDAVAMTLCLTLLI